VTKRRGEERRNRGWRGNWQGDCREIGEEIDEEIGEEKVEEVEEGGKYVIAKSGIGNSLLDCAISDRSSTHTCIGFARVKFASPSVKEVKQ
jgi:hypothetical protein